MLNQINQCCNPAGKGAAAGAVGFVTILVQYHCTFDSDWNHGTASFFDSKGLKPQASVLLSFKEQACLVISTFHTYGAIFSQLHFFYALPPQYTVEMIFKSFIALT